MLKKNKMIVGVPVVVQRKQIQLVSMRMQVWSLAFLSGLRIQCCCELWCRSQTGLDPMLLWLWCRPAAAGPIQLLAWEFPYASSVALKSKNKSKQTKNEMIIDHHFSWVMALLSGLHWAKMLIFVENRMTALMPAILAHQDACIPWLVTSTRTGPSFPAFLLQRWEEVKNMKSRMAAFFFFKAIACHGDSSPLEKWENPNTQSWTEIFTSLRGKSDRVSGSQETWA